MPSCKSPPKHAAGHWKRFRRCNQAAARALSGVARAARFCDPALVCHCESRRPFRYGFDSSQARQTVRWGRFQALLFAPETRAKAGCGTRRLCTFAARKPVEKAWTGLYEPRNGLSNKAARTLPEKQAGHTCKRFFSLARLFQGCE